MQRELLAQMQVAQRLAQEQRRTMQGLCVRCASNCAWATLSRNGLCVVGCGFVVVVVVCCGCLVVVVVLDAIFFSLAATSQQALHRQRPSQSTLCPPLGEKECPVAVERSAARPPPARPLAILCLRGAVWSASRPGPSRRSDVLSGRCRLRAAAVASASRTDDNMKSRTGKVTHGPKLVLCVACRCCCFGHI